MKNNDTTTTTTKTWKRIAAGSYELRDADGTYIAAAILVGDLWHAGNRSRIDPQGYATLKIAKGFAERITEAS